MEHNANTTRMLVIVGTNEKAIIASNNNTKIQEKYVHYQINVANSELKYDEYPTKGSCTSHIDTESMNVQSKLCRCIALHCLRIVFSYYCCCCWFSLDRRSTR